MICTEMRKKGEKPPVHQENPTHNSGYHHPHVNCAHQTGVKLILLNTQWKHNRHCGDHNASIQYTKSDRMQIARTSQEEKGRGRAKCKKKGVSTRVREQHAIWVRGFACHAIWPLDAAPNFHLEFPRLILARHRAGMLPSNRLVLVINR